MSKRDFAFHPLDAARQFAPGQAPGRTAVERFNHSSLSGRRRKDRFEHIAFGTVGARDLEILRWRDREPAAVLRIEQSVEQGR